MCWELEGRGAVHEVELGRGPTAGRAEAASVVFGAGRDEAVVRKDIS